jgi:hypothetical protein
MKRFAAVLLVAAGSFLALQALTACSSTLSQPFEQLKTQPVTIHRLNNVPPQQAAPAGAAPGLPQLPPQVQDFANGLAKMLPPGLLPPGLIPGSTPAPTPANTPLFYNFPILGSMQVIDTKTHDEILELFGKEKNFEAPKQQCMYAEFGFTIGQPAPAGMPQGTPNPNAPADILVSLSCHQVQMFNQTWPYGTKTGTTPDTDKKILDIVRRAFGG